MNINVTCECKLLFVVLYSCLVQLLTVKSNLWGFFSLEHNNGRNSDMGTTHSDSSQGKFIQLVVCA